MKAVALTGIKSLTITNSCERERERSEAWSWVDHCTRCLFICALHWCFFGFLEYVHYGCWFMYMHMWLCVCMCLSTWMCWINVHGYLYVYMCCVWVSLNQNGEQRTLGKYRGRVLGEIKFSQWQGLQLWWSLESTRDSTRYFFTSVEKPNSIHGT